MNIVDKVSELITKQVEEKGYKIVNIEYLKEDGIYYLRIIIDNVRPAVISSYSFFSTTVLNE